jgi:hypothetical protein
MTDGEFLKSDTELVAVFINDQGDYDMRSIVADGLTFGAGQPIRTIRRRA